MAPSYFVSFFDLTPFSPPTPQHTQTPRCLEYLGAHRGRHGLWLGCPDFKRTTFKTQEKYPEV